MSAAICLDDVTISYDRHPAVHHLSGSFAVNSLTAIAGPNGGGKSTLLRALVGLIQPDQGRISRDLRTPHRVAWLAQQSRLDPTFPLTVGELAAMGLWPQIGGWRASGRRGWAQVDEALQEVGLAGFHKRSLGSLSAGQLQRALFARLLLQDGDIVLLDEPFNALDARTTQDLLDVVKRWHGKSKTVIAVLHDLEVIARDFPQTLLLAREGIAWGATAEVMTAENTRRARVVTESWQANPQVCRREGK